MQFTLDVSPEDIKAGEKISQNTAAKARAANNEVEKAAPAPKKKTEKKALPPHVEEYIEKGWTVIPLPAGEKFPPKSGTTGNIPPLTKDEILECWATADENNNVGLRTPDNVIVLDVDQYNGKTGDDNLNELLAVLGVELPPTVMSKSRGDDNPSRHLFYRVPAGFKWESQVCDDVEVAQMSHRYVVAAPSQVEGREYRWFSADGTPLTGVPCTEDLAELPAALQEVLKKSALTLKNAPTHDYGHNEALEWLISITQSFFAEMSPAFQTGLEKVDMAGGAHDEMVSRVHWAVRFAVEEGQPGLGAVLSELERLFLEEMASRTVRRVSSEMAKAEFDSALVSEINNVRGEIEHGLLVPFVSKYAGLEIDLSTTAGAEEAAEKRAEATAGVEELAELAGVPETERKAAVERFQRDTAAENAKKMRRVRDGQAYAKPESLSIEELLAMDLGEEKWVVDGLIEDGQQILIYSAGKQGKSAWVQELLSAVSSGRPFLGQYATAAPTGNVGLVDVELPARKLIERLGNREWGENNLKVYSLRGNIPGQEGMMKLDLSDERSREEWVQRWKEDEIEYLVVDPLSALIREAGLDEWHEAGLALRHLQTMTAEAGIRAHIVVTHASSKKDGMDQGPRGDSAMMDVPDNVWSLQNDREADTMTLETIGRTESKKIVANWEPGTRFSFKYEEGDDAPAEKKKVSPADRITGEYLSQLMHAVYDHAFSAVEELPEDEIEWIGPGMVSLIHREKYRDFFPSKGDLIELIKVQFADTGIHVKKAEYEQMPDILVKRGKMKMKKGHAHRYIPVMDPETISGLRDCPGK